MFFQQDQINPALICPHCSKKLRDPHLLPCGISYCQNCILELMLANDDQNKQFECESCDSAHQEPNGGFTKIKNLAVLLEQHPEKVWRGENVKSLEECLNLIQSKLERITAKHSTPLIQKHCANLKNEIDLQTDTLKNKLDNQREKLFAKIDEYEKSCVGNVEKIQNEGEFSQLVKEMSAFLSQWFEYLKQFKIDENEISKAVQLCYDKLTSIEKFYESKVLFDEQRRLRFRANEENGIDLGELVVEKATIDLFPRFDHTNEINLSTISPDSKLVLVEPMKNGNFIIASITSNNRLNFKIINSNGTILKEHNNFKNYTTHNIIICLNDNLIFLYNIDYNTSKSYLDSINHDLFQITSINLDSISSMTSNDSSLFVLRNQTILVYNTQLIHQYSITFNTNHTVLPYYLPNPSSIKRIKVKFNKLYILSRDSVMTIFDIATGILVKKFPMNGASYFGFYSDNIIACLSENKISFYSDRGVLMREVELKSNQDFCLSENGHKIVIFDKNKLVF